MYNKLENGSNNQTQLSEIIKETNTEIKRYQNIGPTGPFITEIKKLHHGML
jgi:hypothetical protein